MIPTQPWSCSGDSAHHPLRQGNRYELVEYICVTCSRQAVSRFSCCVSPLDKSMVVKPVNSHDACDRVALRVLTAVGRQRRTS
jgi:hypothetical protein